MRGHCRRQWRRSASSFGPPGSHIQDADAAFGTALLSDAINSTDPLIFFAGTNVGAAAYEYGVARLSRTFLNRVSRRIA